MNGKNELLIFCHNENETKAQLFSDFPRFKLELPEISTENEKLSEIFGISII